MTKVLIFGHKNPDTDTVCSAIAYNELKKAKGENTEAVILGEINDETKYALETFGVEIPRIVTSVETGQEVILVDHNEFQQSIDGIEQAIVKEVVDHHRIANFETAAPLYYRCEPVGCTATILKKIFMEQDVKISKKVAGLMLSAIVSDSLLFKSPTCTPEDEKSARELAEIAGVNIEEYGLAMLKAGADTKSKTIKELIDVDAKTFIMNGEKLIIAQINTVDAKEVTNRKDELETTINAEVSEKKLSAFVFVITNILTSDSEVLVLGDMKEKVANAFGKNLVDNFMTLEGVVSRKKQVVPQITEEFNK
ncbi:MULTISPECIES: manganese-dependent inorganic pyrophosphatase [unclassified Gemella]|uniref:manganese-dependent inorganic pyrophosphatase n=1 Tax=unclassified Gemella TaxID=2624949 RepID=UPI001073DC5A|nr:MULTISPECIES: manganese-dependent inorganic pyrophosphatase [unclassified Gemella]MBF0710587.1 manganese-dependent inorganic pyrophosphatase [Gemella sp. GL1.1]MBF0746434.1 manganese-dependent inorganic pyrophosphatase [Gemella sp. 19428wG2_WT2a]NYS27931.1 manganese-dependent inorganic pyrophosphatase [Gemella sp. GL1]TFU60217.1 manganese-dependent inorganic pyrophosphatase [Gemella sp. WT2a]